MTFKEVYTEELYNALRGYPEEYAYAPEFVPIVAERMIGNMVRGSFNKDSRAIKATCKRLGVKFTYDAIKRAVLAGVK